MEAMMKINDCGTLMSRCKMSVCLAIGGCPSGRFVESEFNLFGCDETSLQMLIRDDFASAVNSPHCLVCVRPTHALCTLAHHTTVIWGPITF